MTDKTRLAIACAISGLSCVLLFSILAGRVHKTVEVEEPVCEMPAQADTLTEWQLLKMAIMWTESKFNPNAVGSAGDSGIYQMRDIYVREVNRVSGSNYTLQDAFDPETATEMFELMQAHYNPGKDIDTAIYYHNKSASYKAAVRKNLEFVKRYEAARSAVKK